jgi:hypothetical protein
LNIESVDGPTLSHSWGGYHLQRVRRFSTSTGTKVTTAVVCRGQWIKVASISIRASLDFSIVAHAIVVFIRRTVAATHAQCVQLVAVTVAVALRNVRASAFVNGTKSIANVTSVDFTYTIVFVVTDAIHVDVRCTGTSTRTQRILHIAFTVTISLWNVSTSAFIGLPRSVADAAGIVRANTVIHIVANAIGIFIGCTVASAFTKHIQLVSIAVAVALRNV